MEIRLLKVQIKIWLIRVSVRVSVGVEVRVTRPVSNVMHSTFS